MLHIIKRDLSLLTFLSCFADLPTKAQKMDFEEYEPRSTLVVPMHIVTRANHQQA